MKIVIYPRQATLVQDHAYLFNKWTNKIPHIQVLGRHIVYIVPLL